MIPHHRGRVGGDIIATCKNHRTMRSLATGDVYVGKRMRFMRALVHNEEKRAQLFADRLELDSNPAFLPYISQTGGSDQ